MIFPPVQKGLKELKLYHALRNEKARSWLWLRASDRQITKQTGSNVLRLPLRPKALNRFAVLKPQTSSN